MRVMNHVVNQVHVACREHLDNALAASLPPPRSIPLVAAALNRNRMRKMEDRHVAIDDLNYLCDIEVFIICFMSVLMIFEKLIHIVAIHFRVQKQLDFMRSTMVIVERWLLFMPLLIYI